MADIGRVAKTFYQHPKAIRARAIEPGSISLWLFANCWCRNHRMQGSIPKDKALELGTPEEIAALVESGLWADSGDEYVFHDWRDWNPDTIKEYPKSSAAWLVYENVPDHPFAVQQRLASEVLKLMDEGMATPLIVSGLQKWRGRAGAPVTWLSYFVSDALKESQTGLPAALREARQSGKVTLLAEFGYRWTPPDPPSGATVKQIRELMEAHKREWVDSIENDLKKCSSG